MEKKSFTAPEDQREVKREVAPEKATDMQLASELIKHLIDPCGEPDGNNLRDFYIRESIKSLSKMKDPDAIKMLKNAVDAYSRKREEF